MAVLWCRQCGALIGLREPLDDWSTEQGQCLACIPRRGETPFRTSEEGHEPSKAALETPAEGT